VETLHGGKRTSGSQDQGEKSYQAKSKAPLASRQCHAWVLRKGGKKQAKMQLSLRPDIVRRRDGPDPRDPTRTTQVGSRRKMPALTNALLPLRSTFIT
jgi:hypothetical protein